jgi:hypothetical protein
MTTETTAAATAQKVFICYRREETAPYAGRIYDAMVAKFGVENVFMDLDLDPGVDFVDRITKVVSGCVALIVVIGPRWAQLQNEDGGKRIADPDDFVRLEVETGLKRDDVLLVPALVGGARMPRREELPEELQTLARRNALELSEGRWRYDVGRLLDSLDELLPERVEPKEVSPEPPRKIEPAAPDLGWRLALEGALIAGLTAFGARLLGELLPKVKETPENKRLVYALEEQEPDGEKALDAAKHIASITVRRTETLALVGGVLAIWLTRRIRRGDPYRHLVRGLVAGALAGLVGGLIWGLAVFGPPDTVTFTTRARWDVLTGAVSGGILAWLIGWLWRPPRIRPAIVAGALGGIVMPLVVVVTEWQNLDATEAAFSFALGAAAVVGVTIGALLVADRAERRSAVGQAPRT